MQTNHPRERGKKPFLWIFVAVTVLLAGALALYAWHMQTRPPQVPTPVVARGKILPPPPAPSVESPAGPSASMESAPPTEAGGPEDVSGAQSQGDLEAVPTASVDAGPREIAPEMKSEIDAPPQEDAAAGTGHKSVDHAKQTVISDGQTPAPAPDDSGPATTAVDEPQAAVQEAPESSSPAGDVTPPSTDRTGADAAPAQTVAANDTPETTAPFAIQVGAYRTKSNADRQVVQLRKKGFDAYIHEKNDKDQNPWYFVRFGGFEDFGSADKALAAFKEQERMDGAIVRSDGN